MRKDTVSMENKAKEADLKKQLESILVKENRMLRQGPMDLTLLQLRPGRLGNG